MMTNLPILSEKSVSTDMRSAMSAARIDGNDSSLTILHWLARSGELLPAWWSQNRDTHLRKFWIGSDILSGAMYSVVSRTCAIPCRVEARDMNVQSHQELAALYSDLLFKRSQLLQGWSALMEHAMQDYLGQDNGMFIEVLGPGDPSGPIKGAPISLYHRDASRCIRTADPEFPVVYNDRSGKRYKMHYSRIIYASQLPSANNDMNGVGFCLHRDSTVLMADGSYRRIVDIVNERSQDQVMSRDEYGHLVPKMVTNWYTNARGNRRLINIRGKYASLCQGSKERNSWVTEDHPVLTPSGYVPAGSLKTGDAIVTGLPKPNNKQMEFIVGTLLGDGSLPANKTGRARLSLGHCKEQEEWFRIKERVLVRDFGFTSREGSTKLTYKGVTTNHKCLSGQTLAHSSFMPIRDAFYKDGKKVVPFELVEKYWSPRLLATWYMDDGNTVDAKPNPRNRKPHARIATNGFTVQECEKIAELLSRHGYEAGVISARGDPNKRNIRLSVVGSAKFFADIAPYVPFTMRYKLPAFYMDFAEPLWDLGIAETMEDTVIIKDKWEKLDGRTKKLLSEASNVYCIDVEDTHNFISAGIVVHNCAVSRCVNAAQNLMDVARYKQEKLGSRPPRQIILGKGVSAKDIGRAFVAANAQMSSENLSVFSKTVVLGANDTNVGLELFDLASVPDGFDENTATNLGVYIIALAFGTDARDFWPATSSGATKADALVQHMKARGKGTAQILQMLTEQIENKFLPDELKLVFDLQDDEEDEMQANIRSKRAVTRKVDIDDKVTSLRVAREHSLRDNDMSQEQFEELELADGRLPDGMPVLTLFYSKDPLVQELLKLPIPEPMKLILEKPEKPKEPEFYITPAPPKETRSGQPGVTPPSRFGESRGNPPLRVPKPMFSKPNSPKSLSDNNVDGVGQDTAETVDPKLKLAINEAIMNAQRRVVWASTARIKRTALQCLGALQEYKRVLCDDVVEPPDPPEQEQGQDPTPDKNPSKEDTTNGPEETEQYGEASEEAK